MNFTREPIIETIISPKEGCKLLIRTSKNVAGAEEYFVDAVEVVSFGRAFFFRSLERPKPFLVPASDYEVLEVKETRVALKNVSHERNIKIGGGREAPVRHTHREPPPEREQEAEVAEEELQPAAEEAGLESAIGARMDKRRDRRRRRHRRSGDEPGWSERRPGQQESQQPQHEGEQKARGGSAGEETKVSTHLFSSLIPPPATLISETISRYKDKEFMEGGSHKEGEHKQSKKEPPAEAEPTGSDSTHLSRVPASVVESRAFPVSDFSPLQSGSEFYF